MRFLSIVVCLTWLTIFVPSSVYAQDPMSADKPGSSAKDAKGRPEVQKPPQEQPSTQPVDITGHGEADSDDARPRTRDDVIRETLLGTTGRGETDSNDTRPRTQDDVIREILSNHSTDKHPVPQ